MAENYKILSQEFAESVTETAGIESVGFVAVFDFSTTAAYSTDGIAWTQTTLPNNTQWSSVTYGDDAFVAVYAGSSMYFGPAAHSTDGITWTETSMPDAIASTFGGPVPGEYHWKSVTYGDSKFVAVAEFYYSSGSTPPTAAHSTDGITWTETTTPIGGRSVTYGDGTFAAVAYGSTTAAHSTDGITWTETTLPASVGWESVTYGDDAFVAVANFSNIAAYSTDAITWTQTTLPSAEWKSVTYGDGTFAAVALYSSIAAYSTDGIAWTQTTLPANATWKSVTYGDSKFVAVADGDAAHSTDGITWTQATTPFGGTSVTYGEKDIVVSTNNSKTLYTTPSSTEASISSISVINNGTESGDYYLGVVKSADSSTPGISNTQTIIPNKTLAAGAIDEIVGGITLSAGDQIRIFSESPDITAHIYGVELS